VHFTFCAVLASGYCLLVFVLHYLPTLLHAYETLTSTVVFLNGKYTALQHTFLKFDQNNKQIFNKKTKTPDKTKKKI